MAPDEVRPFLARQRRDVLATLAGRQAAVDRGIGAAVARALDPESVKLDGKAGAFDGKAGGIDVVALLPPDELKFLAPDEKTGKEGTKDTKETKDVKETKDGEKEATKEGKEGKDTKDGAKESKETKDKEVKDKESKDTKDGTKDTKDGKDGKEEKDDEVGKLHGIEIDVMAFQRFGDAEQLPWDVFNEIARAHPERMRARLERGIVF
jgi:hypothetical protein